MNSDIRNSVINAIKEEKFIVIFRKIARENMIATANALYDAGVRLIEVTFSQDGSISDEQTADNIKMLVEAMGGKMMIGAGTVTKPSQVELAAKAGALFILSPDVCVDVIKKTRELGLVSMPGAVTPTESMSAYRAGADFIKLFPILELGPSYVKAVRAPLSGMDFLAVGITSKDDIKPFLKVGIAGFGISSEVYVNQLVEAGKYDELTRLTAEYVADAKRENKNEL